MWRVSLTECLLACSSVYSEVQVKVLPCSNFKMTKIGAWTTGPPILFVISYLLTKWEWSCWREGSKCQLVTDLRSTETMHSGVRNCATTARGFPAFPLLSMQASFVSFIFREDETQSHGEVWKVFPGNTWIDLGHGVDDKVWMWPGVHQCVYVRARCTCENAARCDHVTGDCHCSPGWTGEDCSQTCRPGYWGTECRQVTLEGLSLNAHV